MAEFAYRYLDLHLAITDTGSGFRAAVVEPSGGRGAPSSIPATADFDNPFSQYELSDFFLKVGRARQGAGAAPVVTRRIETPQMAAQKFGTRLFQAVFDGEVGTRYADRRHEAEEQGLGLRVWLNVKGAGELADLPWEYLYDPSDEVDRFLSLSIYTPVVRHSGLRARRQPQEVETPLRILVATSSPEGYPPVSSGSELTKLREALAGLERDRRVKLEVVEDATLQRLHEQLLRGSYHVLHFIGHGDFDEGRGEGVLALEDEQGNPSLVSADSLAVILQNCPSLRLAVLNACEGARTGRADPFAGIAQSLIQKGLPAVIGMQFEITNQAAECLSQTFYQAIAVGLPVDAALAHARTILYGSQHGVEWGTPVLHLRVGDGRIFDVTGVDAGEVIPALQQRTEEALQAPVDLSPLPVTPPPVVAPAVANGPAIGPHVTETPRPEPDAPLVRPAHPAEQAERGSAALEPRPSPTPPTKGRLAAIVVALTGVVAGLAVAGQTCFSPPAGPSPTVGPNSTQPGADTRPNTSGGSNNPTGSATSPAPNGSTTPPSPWQKSADLGMTRDAFGVASVGGKVYLVGGNGGPGWDSLDTIDEYNPEVGTSPLLTLKPARSGAGVAVHENKIYTVGGFSDDSGFLRTVERHDPNAPSSPPTAFPDLPGARSMLGAAAVGGKLYAVGGCTGASSPCGPTGTVQVLDIGDPRAGWKSGPALSRVRGRLSVVASGGKIYAIGGYDERSRPNPWLNTVEVYEPGAGSWKGEKEGVAQLNTPRAAPAVVADDRRIYVVGGLGPGDRTLDTVEVYDIQANTWTVLESTLSTPRYRGGLALAGDWLYVMGGCKSSCNDASQALSTVEKAQARRVN